MNETKKAIEHFHYGITHDIFSEPVTTYARLAVDALREQAERSKGCEYCNSRFGIATHHINGQLLQAGTKKIAIYCPMCGRRLEVEP